MTTRDAFVSFHKQNHGAGVGGGAGVGAPFEGAIVFGIGETTVVSGASSVENNPIPEVDVLNL